MFLGFVPNRYRIDIYTILNRYCILRLVQINIEIRAYQSKIDILYDELNEILHLVLEL